MSGVHRRGSAEFLLSTPAAVNSKVYTFSEENRMELTSSPERAKFNSTGHRPVSCIKINYKPCKGNGVKLSQKLFDVLVKSKFVRISQLFSSFDLSSGSRSTWLHSKQMMHLFQYLFCLLFTQ